MFQKLMIALAVMVLTLVGAAPLYSPDVTLQASTTVQYDGNLYWYQHTNFNLPGNYSDAYNFAGGTCHTFRNPDTAVSFANDSHLIIRVYKSTYCSDHWATKTLGAYRAYDNIGFWARTVKVVGWTTPQ